MGHRVPLQIVNKKTCPAVFLHPLQHFHQLVICKMMAEQRIEDDIGFVVTKIHEFVVGANKLCGGKRSAILRSKIGTSFIDVNANIPHLPALDRTMDRLQVVAATATDLRYRNR